jgi:hypothetical protein
MGQAVQSIRFRQAIRTVHHSRITPVGPLSSIQIGQDALLFQLSTVFSLCVHHLSFVHAEAVAQGEGVGQMEKRSSLECVISMPMVSSIHIIKYQQQQLELLEAHS